MPRPRGIPVPNLASIRLQKGYTQKDLAARMKPPGGVTAISKAERGGTAGVGTIKRWARVLGVKMEDLTIPPEKQPKK